VGIEPEELPEHAGKQKILIGEDTSERLDVIAPKFRVIVTHRPKYAFKNEDGVIPVRFMLHLVRKYTESSINLLTPKTGLKI
jgi:transposase